MTTEDLQQVQNPILFFDGVCHLCNFSVDLLLRIDKSKTFRFAPIQGKTAQKFLTGPEIERIESLILFHGHYKFFKSDAVLESLILIGGWYKVFRLLKIIPKPLRDIIYTWIAKNRYRWFGREEQCRIPLPHEKFQLWE